MATERDIDRQLVERARQGDKMAFDMLVTKYERRLFRLVMALIYLSPQKEQGNLITI